MTTAAQYAQMGSAHALGGGEWVRGPGGVQTWVPALVEQLIARVWRAPIPAPPPGELDLHQLYACTTCEARVDEPCRSTVTGRTADRPHVGRLVSRRCRCGKPVTYTSRACGGCLGDAKVIT